VSPGDVVVADDDGVVVVPAAVAEDAFARPHGSAKSKSVRLAAGIPGLDMYNMREPLQKAGLKYVD
jgi:4-hydroxy-4-methyl-2-oxoglutarate aldolase